jgi:hypothetical protein
MHRRQLNTFHTLIWLPLIGLQCDSLSDAMRSRTGLLLTYAKPPRVATAYETLGGWRRYLPPRICRLFLCARKRRRFIVVEQFPSEMADGHADDFGNIADSRCDGNRGECFGRFAIVSERSPDRWRKKEEAVREPTTRSPESARRRLLPPSVKAGNRRRSMAAVHWYSAAALPAESEKSAHATVMGERTLNFPILPKHGIAGRSEGVK